MEKFFYRAENGDTVFSVSERFDIPAMLIIKHNNLKREIEQGDLLYLERGNYRAYKVKPFDTIEELAKKFCTTPEKILDDNGIKYIFYGLTIIV